MKILRVLFLTTLGMVFFSKSVSAEVTVVSPNEFDISLIYPLGLALTIALFLWRVFLPRQLSNLQVAFEIDDNLYEVHRLSKDVKGARELLAYRSVQISTGLYMMGMTGILLLIAELIFDASTYYLPNLFIIGLLILIPVLVSPWETLNGQLVGRKAIDKKSKLGVVAVRRLVTMILLITATFATLFAGINIEGKITEEWLSGAMLVLMGPTILAYGRIMGASWNILLLSKWRSVKGRRTPIDPDKPKVTTRIVGLILVLFLITMPLTAINGIVTTMHVLFQRPENSEDILNFGGIIGYTIYSNIDIIEQIIGQIELLKSLPQILSLYLSMNIAIVGLAFIFELARNLLLGGQVIGGVFGVTLASPRETRTEIASRGRQLSFAFAGFSGYTVLLLILVCYKEFGDLMPFIDWLTSYGFDEEMRLLTTWMFISVGQLVFLLTWILSAVKFPDLAKVNFDLDPMERREGEVQLASGDWMREIVDTAALNEDLDTLIRFQKATIDADDSVVRIEKNRAKMWEYAIRGLWPDTIEQARKVLAQAGGNDDEARMLISVGHIASRRLDAAREAIRGLEQAEGYDEPELIAFMCEWMDPWHGTVSEDDLWDWENNSCIDNLQDLMSMLAEWDSSPKEEVLHKDRLSDVARLSRIAMLRMQRKSDAALEIALDLVKRNPLSVRARIATALCLIDSGKWHGARSILQELQESDPNDPRVKSLAATMGEKVNSDDLEIALAKADENNIRRFIDDTPTNPVAAISVKGGEDEAMNANVFIMSFHAIKSSLTPRFSASPLNFVFNYLLLIPIIFTIGIIGYIEYGELYGIGIVAFGIFMHQTLRIYSRQQRSVIKHRDQKDMIDYARRVKRFKAIPSLSTTPIGTHMLLSGILVTVNGVVLDLGFPAWLTRRLPKDGDRIAKERISKKAKSMMRLRPPRLKKLGKSWWLNRPKEDIETSPILEELVGPMAYRGRLQRMDTYHSKFLNNHESNKSTRQVSVSRMDMSKRQIPRNTIRRETSNVIKTDKKDFTDFKI